MAEGTAPEGSTPGGGLTEEDLRRLEEQLRQLKVSDVLVQTIYTLSSLGFGRLVAEERDLDQARMAIEAIGALLPVLEGSLPPEAIRDFNQVKANLQLAYAGAVAEGSSSAPSEPAEDEGKGDAGDG